MHKDSMRDAVILEESVETFIARWRGYAQRVRSYARPEGSPLLELNTKGHILHVFERTNPYTEVGEHHAIIHALVSELEPAPQPRKQLHVHGVSRLEASGIVIEQQPHYLVIDSGIPIVVGLLHGLLHTQPTPASHDVLGQWLRFHNQPPLHGFIVQQRPDGNAMPLDESDAI